MFMVRYSMDFAWYFHLSVLFGFASIVAILNSRTKNVSGYKGKKKIFKKMTPLGSLIMFSVWNVTVSFFAGIFSCTIVGLVYWGLGKVMTWFNVQELAWGIYGSVSLYALFTVHNYLSTKLNSHSKVKTYEEKKSGKKN